LIISVPGILYLKEILAGARSLAFIIFLLKVNCSLVVTIPLLNKNTDGDSLNL
jgi:hypothetical protein